FKGVVARPVADLRLDFVGVLLSRRRVSPSSPLHAFRDILVAAAQRLAHSCSYVPARHACAMSSYDRSRSVYPCMIVAIMISSARVRWASACSPASTVDGEPTM